MTRRIGSSLLLAAVILLGQAVTGSSQPGKDPRSSHHSASEPGLSTSGLDEKDLARRLGIAGEEYDFQKIYDRLEKSGVLKKLDDAQKKKAFDYFQNHKDELTELSKKFDLNSLKKLKPNDIEALKAQTKDFKGAIEKQPEIQPNNLGGDPEVQLPPKFNVKGKPVGNNGNGSEKANPGGEAAKAGSGADQTDWIDGLTERFADVLGDIDPVDLHLRDLLDGMKGDRFAFEGIDKDFFSGFSRFGENMPTFDRLDMPSFSMPEFHLPSMPNISMPEMPSMPQLPSWGGGSMPSAGGFGGAAGGVGLLQVLLWVAVVGVLGFLVWKVMALSREETAEARARRLGEWPIDPRRIATRGELVQAFEYLTLLLLGFEACTRNHVEIAHEFGDRNSSDPQRQRSEAELLAWHYEQARYAPEAEALSETDLAESRRALCFLAGVAPA